MCSDLFVKVIVFKQKGKASLLPNHNLVWLYLSTRNQNPARARAPEVKKRLCVLFGLPSVENQKSVLTQLSLSLPLRTAWHKHAESRTWRRERSVWNTVVRIQVLLSHRKGQPGPPVRATPRQLGREPCRARGCACAVQIAATEIPFSPSSFAAIEAPLAPRAQEPEPGLRRPL